MAAVVKCLVLLYLLFKSHTQLFSSYVKRSRPRYLADFAEIWLAGLFKSPNIEMDVKSSNSFYFGKYREGRFRVTLAVANMADRRSSCYFNPDPVIVSSRQFL